MLSLPREIPVLESESQRRVRDDRREPGCRRRQRGDVGLDLLDTLGGGLLEPRARSRRIRFAGDAFGEITAEHQLSLAVPQLGRGAKPALCGRPVLGLGN